MSIQSKNSVKEQLRAACNPNRPQGADSPTSHEYQLLIERRGAEANGYEVPLDSEEAAAYIGSSLECLISMALAGEVPAHPLAGGSRSFYVSELTQGKLTSQPRAFRGPTLN